MPASPCEILHKSVCIFLCNSLHHHIAILCTVIMHYTTIRKSIELREINSVGVYCFVTIRIRHHERLRSMKTKIMIGMLGALLLVTGCSVEKEKSEAKTDKTQIEQEADKENATPTEKENEVLTKKIQDEEGVIGGRVYEQNGTAIGILMLEKEVNDVDAKKLAERYAVEIKKEYKDLPVNIQAIRDGENVANIQLDE